MLYVSSIGYVGLVQPYSHGICDELLATSWDALQ